MEPHIEPFEVPYVPETDIGKPRSFFLHTSPEYAMKRLLADGSGPLFQLCKVFRNGEISASHNPEFTLLEFYRPHADYRAIMDDLERCLAAVEAAVLGAGSPRAFFSKTPYERLTVREAMLRHAGVDIETCADVDSLRAAAEMVGVRVQGEKSWDDVFFHLFLEKVESKLGAERPTFLIEYPARMASLARLKPSDPKVAERVELYARGVELANGFSELTDPAEQRRRFEQEQEERRAAGRKAYPMDEKFLAALGKMPASSGIAVGMDRILMSMLEASSIEEVLLFPANEYFS
jgi:lysyl-tRNA synthetase class 2